ncbi:MAG: BatD family protein [Thermoflavifilum sp.]|nr:BatD family protein [Thermoflavifilum sp.]MBX5439701.1 BatD family protein [Thermoflavifilum sp.]
MKRSIHYSWHVLLSGWLCFWTGMQAMAQSSPVHFTTRVQSHTVDLHQPFQVQFILENAQHITAFTPPSFKGFQVLQNFQSQQTSIVNGQVSSSYTVTYVLQPMRAGKFTIEGATATVDGATLRSNPVTIQVAAGMASNNAGSGSSSASSALPMPSAPGFMPPDEDESDLGQFPGLIRSGEDPMAVIRKNVFVKVNVDKTDVYQGEQIVATYKLYTRLQTTSDVMKVPAFSGFSTHDIDLPNPPQATTEIVDGKRFKVFTIRKTILFPLQTGNLQLDPVEIDNKVRLYILNRSPRHVRHGDPLEEFLKDPFHFNPFDDPFFDDPFGGGSGLSYRDFDYHLSSNPVTIHVKPLPEEGKPENFTGAVGNFTITATVDKPSLSTDDAGTLKVTVSGEGNLQMISAPAIDFPGSFDTYDPKIEDHFRKNSIPFSGSRTFEYVFMPHAAGDYTIPAIRFAYFDPQTKTYKQVETEPIALHVTMGNRAATAPVDFGQQHILPDQLAPIHFSPLLWLRSDFTLWRQWWYWMLLALPLAGIWFWRRQQRKLALLRADEVLWKNKQANRIARKRLAQAGELLRQHQEKAFYQETSQALWGYLSHKCNIPFAALSREKVREALLHMSVQPEQVESLFQLLDHCEQALYAPAASSGDMEKVYQQAMQWISSLESQLNK